MTIKRFIRQLLVDTDLCKSLGEARRLITGGGCSIVLFEGIRADSKGISHYLIDNKFKVESEDATIVCEDFVLLSGKHRQVRVNSDFWLSKENSYMNEAISRRVKSVEVPAVSEVNKLKKDLKAAVKRIEKLENNRMINLRHKVENGKEYMYFTKKKEWIHVPTEKEIEEEWN